MERDPDPTSPKDVRTVLSLVACIVALVAGYALAVIFASASLLAGSLVLGSRYGVDRPLAEDLAAFLLVLRFMLPVVAAVALPGWLAMRGLLVLLAMRFGRPRPRTELSLFAAAGVISGMWFPLVLELDAVQDGRGAMLNAEALGAWVSYVAAGIAGGIGAWLGEKAFGGCTRPTRSLPGGSGADPIHRVLETPTL